MIPDAIDVLEKNPKKFRWGLLECNTNAMHLLEKNVEILNWSVLSSNPSIFTKKINYAFLRKRISLIREELIMKSMHPSRLERFLEMGGNIDDF